MEPNKFYEQDVLDFFKHIDYNTADLIIADPPYNMNKADWDRFACEGDFYAFSYEWIKETERVLKDGGSIYIFNTALHCAHFLVNCVNTRGLSFRNWIVWYKSNGQGGEKKKYTHRHETILYLTKGDNYTYNYNDIRVPYAPDSFRKVRQKNVKMEEAFFNLNKAGALCSEVWTEGIVHFKHEHPTPKPFPIIERMIKASSNAGDMVIDPFAGSGVTAILCHQLGRQWMCNDKDISIAREEFDFQTRQEVFKFVNEKKIAQEFRDEL